jgi:hypothetical protein
LFRDGDYLFQFAKVPVSQMDVVAFKRCWGLCVLYKY